MLLNFDNAISVFEINKMLKKSNISLELKKTECNFRDFLRFSKTTFKNGHVFENENCLNF